MEGTTFQVHVVGNTALFTTDITSSILSRVGQQMTLNLFGDLWRVIFEPSNPSNPSFSTTFCMIFRSVTTWRSKGTLLIKSLTLFSTQSFLDLGHTLFTLMWFSHVLFYKFCLDVLLIFDLLLLFSVYFHFIFNLFNSIYFVFIFCNFFVCFLSKFYFW